MVFAIIDYLMDSDFECCITLREMRLINYTPEGFMTNKHLSPAYETLLGGVVLSFVGGTFETYTYLLRGGVFCNAQTGNIALMMLNLASGDFAKALYYPVPILAFAFGVFISNFAFAKDEKSFSLRDKLLMMEIFVLAVLTLVPAGFGDTWVNAVISFLAAVQYNAFRKAGGISYSSVFCTNNLRQSTLCLYEFLLDKNRAALTNFFLYLLVILAFCGGVAAQVIAIKLLGQYSTTLPITCLVFLLMINFCMNKDKK